MSEVGLAELCAARGWAPPVYALIGTGPCSVHQVRCSVNGHEIVAEGISKEIAERVAAFSAVRRAERFDDSSKAVPIAKTFFARVRFHGVGMNGKEALLRVQLVDGVLEDLLEAPIAMRWKGGLLVPVTTPVNPAGSTLAEEAAKAATRMSEAVSNHVTWFTLESFKTLEAHRASLEAALAELH